MVEWSGNLRQDFKTEEEEIKMKYKKYLTDALYQDALAMSRSQLQDVSFYGEETTNDWTLKKLQIQFVKDQMEFYEEGNLDTQVEETWEMMHE